MWIQEGSCGSDVMELAVVVEQGFIPPCLDYLSWI